VDLGTASTIPPTHREPEETQADDARAAVDDPPADARAPVAVPDKIKHGTPRRSLANRMMAIAAVWISVLLVGGGFALDRTLTRMVEKNFDDQLEYLLNAMLVVAEIGPDGRINLPLLANVMVANKTDYEIASVIADAYARNVLVSPIVEVRRATLGPQNIIVGGEVNSPGLIALPSPIGALEAVMLAGGFRDTASRQVAILRRAPGGGLMIRTVNLRDALRGRDGADALQLRRNDIVFVPRTTVAEINVFIEQYVNSILPLDQAMSYAIADAITNNN